MAKIELTTKLHRYEKPGDKTGWTYVEIPVDLAEQLKPGHKRAFKVKGKIDAFAIKRVSLMPLGAGRFMLPVNAAMRKGIGKRFGAMVKLVLEDDKSEFVFNKDFMDCLADEPAANNFFKELTGAHQRYFSKWIDDAKTMQTKIKRIVLAVNALAKKRGYPEMLRDGKDKQS